MNVTLNQMKASNLNDVLNVSSLSLKESWSRESLEKELSNPLAKYMVAEVNNKVVGFAGLWAICNEGHITNISVHPNYRGQGIGSKLVESLIENSSSWYINSLTLEVRASNKIAQNLYKKYGFKEEDMRKHYYQDNNEAAIIMWKR